MPALQKRYIRVNVFPRPKGLSCIAEIDIIVHPAAPTSKDPTHMHLFHQMSLLTISTETRAQSLPLVMPFSEIALE